MYLEKKQKAITTGIIEIDTARYLAPWFFAISFDADNVESITGRGNFLGVFKRSMGIRYEFQLPMNAPIDIVAIAGVTIGIAILWNIYHSFAPSIRPASRRDIGRIDRKYCLRKNTVPDAAIEGTISGT